MIVALTGATGFLGGHVLDRFLEAGHQVRAMARRPQTRQTDGLEWIYAALDTPGAFDRLLDGVDVVIHAAGAVNSPTRAGFKYVNVDGTRSILDAAIARAVARFVHVSSLSAREPQLSNYGWSKAEAETIVVTSTTDWRIVRPPAIYGPGDTDNLELFKFAQRGIVPLPAAGRMSLIHADDLARLIVAMAENPDSHMMFEADDGVTGGWLHADYAQAIGAAVGRKPLTLRLPKAVLDIGAALDGLVRGDRAKLTADRVSYMTHPDWVIDPAKRPPADLWQPQITTAQGLKDTALWYRAQGWL